MIPVIQTIENNGEYLLQLRQQLDGFRTASCRLMHEQVTGLRGTPFLINKNPEDIFVHRKGFCTSELRRKLLGCAHSTANDAFARLADKVHATGILGDTLLPSSAISDIVMRIYLMDHEKGHLEKRYALAKHEKDAEEITSIEHDLSDIHARHDAAVAEMEEYRKHLLKHIDKNINTH